MFRKENKLSKKYYPFVEKLFGYKKRAKILKIDFNEPWWDVIWQQKWSMLLFIILDSLYYAYLMFIPVGVGYIISTGKLDYFTWLVIGWATLLITSWVGHYFLVLVEAQAVDGIAYNSVKFFLTVDPLFHSTRSSGQIIAKTNRGSESFETIIDLLSFDLLRTGVKIISLLTIALAVDFKSGVFISICTLVIVFISVVSKMVVTAVVSPVWISNDDKAKANNLETLRENNLIRSSFATAEQDEKIKKSNLKNLISISTGWQAQITGDYLIRLIYVLSFGVYGWMLLELIKSGQNSTILISVMISFVSGFQDVLNIGRVVEKFSDRQTRIKDLFTYIREFGKQTFPVLPNEKLITKNEKQL